MYTLSFTLKQHTPIIHFQHDQDGATLRASEVKPKLDRFIIEKLGMENIDKAWYNNPKKASLDYQLKISPVLSESYPIEEGRTNSFEPFFGNIGTEYLKNIKGIVITENEIGCVIIGKHNEINKFILENEILQEFFALNNFGTRQTKGFGSFSLIKINNSVSNFPAYLFNYSFDIIIQRNLRDDSVTLYKDLFKKINLFYKTLRSGINESRTPVYGVTPKLYFKSLLYEYVTTVLNEQWDKKTIKSHFLQIEQAEQCYTFKDKIVCAARRQNLNLDYKNFRDLLGLSSLEKWGDSFTLTKSHIEQTATGSWALVDKNAPHLITRFKSPLFFKIVRETNCFKVFLNFQLNTVTQLNYTNSFFQIANRVEKEFTLPFYQNFDYNSFLNWVIKNIDSNKRFVVTSDRPRDDFNEIMDSINRIYSQLKKQVQ